jgi:hypothetical protein
VLPALQQLLQLHLQDYDLSEHGFGYDMALSGFGALTKLTQLVLPMVGVKPYGCMLKLQHTIALCCQQ